MAVKHGSSKKVLYKNSLCLRGKYKGKYLGQLRKPTAFGELKQMSWFGHTNRIPETSIVKRIHKWKPFTGRPAGKPKSRWEDDVRNDLNKMKVMKWINLNGRILSRRPRLYQSCSAIDEEETK